MKNMGLIENEKWQPLAHQSHSILTQRILTYLQRSLLGGTCHFCMYCKFSCLNFVFQSQCWGSYFLSAFVVGLGEPRLGELISFISFYTIYTG